jgi:hypothetical protein
MSFLLCWAQMGRLPSTGTVEWLQRTQTLSAGRFQWKRTNLKVLSANLSNAQFLPLTLPTAYLNPFLMGGPSGVGNGNTSKWNSSGKPWHVHCVGYVPFVPLQVCFGPKEAGLNGLECLGSLIFWLLLGFGDEKSGRKRTGIDLPSSSLPNDFRSVCFTSQGQN